VHFVDEIGAIALTAITSSNCPSGILSSSLADSAATPDTNMVEIDNLLRTFSPRELELRNHNCIYCCRALTRATRTREHVIGRHFVPRGRLDINLIAWACDQCNNDKSDLEDDISVISMLPAIVQSHPSMDERSADIARKLQSAFSRRTGKLVRDSQETITIKGQIFPGLTATIKMMSNPQTDPERVGRLAFYHIRAFHYFTTYRKDTKQGWGVPGVFAVAGDYRRPDWGNERARSFMNVTMPWYPRFVLKGKEAFFQVMIRRRLPDILWSWAIEWNQSYRVFGFYGDEKLVENALEQIPILKLKSIVEEPNETIRIREDVALPEADDILFEHEISQSSA
jgi:hypothetical protein